MDNQDEWRALVYLTHALYGGTIPTKPDGVLAFLLNDSSGGEVPELAKEWLGSTQSFTKFYEEKNIIELLSKVRYESNEDLFAKQIIKDVGNLLFVKLDGASPLNFLQNVYPGIEYIDPKPYVDKYEQSLQQALDDTTSNIETLVNKWNKRDPWEITFKDALELDLNHFKEKINHYVGLEDDFLNRYTISNQEGESHNTYMTIQHGAGDNFGVNIIDNKKFTKDLPGEDKFLFALHEAKHLLQFLCAEHLYRKTGRISSSMITLAPFFLSIAEGLALSAMDVDKEYWKGQLEKIGPKHYERVQVASNYQDLKYLGRLNAALDYLNDFNSIKGSKDKWHAFSEGWKEKLQKEYYLTKIDAEMTVGRFKDIDPILAAMYLPAYFYGALKVRKFIRKNKFTTVVNVMYNYSDDITNINKREEPEEENIVVK